MREDKSGNSGRRGRKSTQFGAKKIGKKETKFVNQLYAEAPRTTDGDSSGPGGGFFDELLAEIPSRPRRS